MELFIEHSWLEKTLKQFTDLNTIHNFFDIEKYF